MSLLARIVASKQAEIAAGGPPTAGLPAWPVRDPVAPLRRALPTTPLRLIAEVKRKSPSAGELSTVLGPGERARAYAMAGASMVSVLCDGPFFGGSYADLAGARRALDGAGSVAPLLAKEFILDERQLDWARAHGADAVLLIVRLVDRERLGALAKSARAQGMEPLFEVTDERELAAALACDASLVGVNARDIDTLAMDSVRAARVLAAIPARCVAVHLSGLKVPSDVRAIARSRADAALVGEVLMRQDDPAPLLAELLAATT